jgi:ubiquinone/menaquinone biosynthesis C-methylase UbiE
MSQDNLYQSRWVGAGYDALSWMVFAPLGGLRRLRQEALDAIEIRPGARVLELGCGTGGFTRLLAARGAQLTSVDRSPHVLARARRRAPGATFVESELTAYRPQGSYDVVWVAFVLHELDPAARQAVLTMARSALVPGGTLVIVEHALPAGGLVPRAMSRFVHAFEPASIVDWLRGGFTGELAQAGLTVTSRRPLARGTAVVISGASG